MREKKVESWSGKTARSHILKVIIVSLICLGFVAGMSGCATPKVSETSPQVDEVSFRPSSDMTESSQKAEIRITFDKPVSVSQNVLHDFDLLLNGSPVDPSTVKVEARPDATGVTFVLRPAAEAMGVGKGSYFALYQSDISLSPRSDDGALSSVTGADGCCAVVDEAVAGTFPSGLIIKETESVPGSEASGQSAQTTFEVISPATIRAVTWFSPDGGETLLLKHNHMFMDATIEDCAADLANVINGSKGLGISASAQGSAVTLRASEPKDGQVLHPVIVEGVGAKGGAFVALDE